MNLEIIIAKVGFIIVMWEIVKGITSHIVKEIFNN